MVGVLVPRLSDYEALELAILNLSYLCVRLCY